MSWFTYSFYQNANIQLSFQIVCFQVKQFDKLSKNFRFFFQEEKTHVTQVQS